MTRNIRETSFCVFLLAAAVVPAGAVDLYTHSFNSGMNCYGVWKLPDTSTGPYRSVSGDDSYYQPAISSPSYTNNGDGTTTDNVTGLVWVSSSGAATYTWETALSSCSASSIGNMNNPPGYAGYTDWRLPNVRELMSIVDYGMYTPAINRNAFPGTQNLPYWTSTTYVSGPGSALSVNFNTGGILSEPKTTTYNRVRCVRGGR